MALNTNHLQYSVSSLLKYSSVIIDTMQIENDILYLIPCYVTLTI